ncbi:MAG TPA: DMT family transporter [Chitinophagaceae bacterium]|nr:DMT family transporter [Chitinophagaceae bacterium]
MNEQAGHTNTNVYLKLVMTAMFWGGTFIATRIAAQTFGPFTGAGYRYIFALVLLLPLAFRQNRRLLRVQASQLPVLLLLGFTGIFAYNYFFFKGLKTIPASRGALLAALNPTIVMIISAMVYKEEITMRKLAGIMISLTGVVIVISRGKVTELLSSLETGDLFMLGCPLTWAVYTLAARPALRHTTPLQATTWASLSGVIMLLLFSITEPYPVEVPLKVWVALLYLGLIGTVVAFVWYYDGIRKIGPTRTSIFNNLVPVFAVLFSVIILKEKVSWYTWIGGAMVIGGVLFVNLQKKIIR